MEKLDILDQFYKCLTKIEAEAKELKGTISQIETSLPNKRSTKSKFKLKKGRLRNFETGHAGTIWFLQCAREC